MEQVQDTSPYPVIWRGVRVGTISDTVRDMWYLEGNWEPDKTGMSMQFELLARSLDIKEVVENWSKGTRVIIAVPGSESAQIHSVVLGMDNNILLLRNVFDPEAVQWMMRHVQ